MTWSPDTDALLRLTAEMVRGPRRDGCFALWLLVRVAEDLLTPPVEADRVRRRRVQALERRCSSLTLPAPLRRALTAALLTLRDGTAETVRLAVTQLVPPARETLGPGAADALESLARRARHPVPDATVTGPSRR